MKEQIVVEGIRRSAIFYYRGKEIFGIIPLEDPQIVGGVAVSEDGKPVQNRSVAERVGRASLLYLQMIKPASLGAYQNIPWLAQKVSSDFARYLTDWGSARLVIDQVDRLSNARCFELIRSIGDSYRTIAAETDWVWKNLSANLSTKDLEYEFINNLYLADNRYRRAGRSANENLAVLRDLVSQLQPKITRQFADKNVSRPAMRVINEVVAIARKAPANDFADTLTTSVDRETRLFLQGYRVPLL